jgi:hypothetical protein
MDFQLWKNKNAKVKADHRNPWMGLDGVVCKDPVYWCRLHEIWLSENDVELKKCLARLRPDMLSTYKCKCLERKEKNPFVKEY